MGEAPGRRRRERRSVPAWQAALIREIFVDASFFVAILNPKDRLHQRAERVGRSLGAVRLVTTDGVLTGFAKAPDRMANALIRAAQAAKLLGAEVVLTGIGPAMAVSLINLGADLGGVVTLGTLRAGIAHALSRSTR